MGRAFARTVTSPILLQMAQKFQHGGNLKMVLNRLLEEKEVTRRNLTLVGNIMCARSPKTFSASSMCCRPAENLVAHYSIRNLEAVLARF